MSLQYCTHCGAPLKDPSAKFCPNCGSSIKVAVTPTTDAPPPPPPPSTEVPSTPRIFSLIILVLSFIGFILVTFTPFAGFYLTGYYSGYRYSCLTCGYATAVDRAAIILAMLLLLGQIAISFSELWPDSILSQFLPANFARWGIFFAIFTLIITLIGGAAFMATYNYYETWFEPGFYGGAIVGLLNSILFFLKGRM